MALISNKQTFDTDYTVSQDKKNDWPDTDTFNIDIEANKIDFSGQTLSLNRTAENNGGENPECIQPEKVQLLEEGHRESAVEDNRQMEEACENVALRDSMESINSVDDFSTESTNHANNDIQGGKDCAEVDTVDARKMEDNDMLTECLEETTKEEVFSTSTKVCCLLHDCPLKTETDLDNEEETNMEKEEYGDVDDDDDEGDDMNNTLPAEVRDETLVQDIDKEYGIAAQSNEDTTIQEEQNIETNPDQLQEISDKTNINSLSEIRSDMLHVTSISEIKTANEHSGSDYPSNPENDLSAKESNYTDLKAHTNNAKLETDVSAANPEDVNKLNEQNMKSRREDPGSPSLDCIELQYNTGKAIKLEFLNDMITAFENNKKRPEKKIDQENSSKEQEIMKYGQRDDDFEDDTEEKHCDDKSENLEETDITKESTEQENYSDDFETVEINETSTKKQLLKPANLPNEIDHLMMDEKYMHSGNKGKGIIIQVLLVLVILLLVLVQVCLGKEAIEIHLYPKSLEDKHTTFTKVPYNISSPIDICVCTVGFRGPTCVPPRDDPPDLPPHANLTGIENQENNMSSIPSVSDSARSAENDSRNVEHDRLENIVCAVSEEPLMCNLNDRNSSSDDNGDFEVDSVENYISLRDDHLDISVRPNSSHSTVPLPSLKNSSSELNLTFVSIVTVRDDDTHLPYTGTSFKVANERIPQGEIRDRPTLFFQDGDGSAALQRGNTNYHEAANNQEHTGAERPDFEVDRFLLNLTQGNSLQDIPPGLSDTITRARTFVWQQWPHISYLTPQKMADAGFFYTGIQDITMCFYCGECMDHWKPGDDPTDEHRKVSPGCNFVTLPSDDSAQTEGHQAEDNGAYGTEDPVCHQDTQLKANLSSGELSGESQYRRRCSYARCIQERGSQRLQLESQPWDLQPHGEQNSSDYLGLSNQESSGIQETCGVSCHTEGPSIVNYTVEEALSHLPQQQRRPAGPYSGISRQQGRPVIQDRRILRQHRRQAGPDGRISRQQGRQALPDGSIIRRGGVSGIIQPELRTEMTEGSDAKLHQTGNTRAVSPARNHVSSSMQRIRSAGRIRQTDIDGILDSQVGRMVLYEGYSRTDVARAVRNILRDDGHLAYETIIMALSAFCARRRRHQRARPC